MSARSSDSIRHIAKALAAAQRELQNPQARHEGQIRRELPSGLALIEPYRFASLGDGLSLIRPILGRHGLSLIQATRLDNQVGLLILETRIIHESGEWILADYPVGSLQHGGSSDPRELGAALTYARRQSLFSLIGIAPQNDTDGCPAAGVSASAQVAPPPVAYADRQRDHQDPQAPPERNDQGPVGSGGPIHTVPARFNASPSHEPLPQPLERSRSSEDRLGALMEELGGLAAPEQLRSWAIERIKAMAMLLPQDRRRLNEAFVARRSAMVEHGARECEGADPRGREHPEPEVAEPRADEANGTIEVRDPALRSRRKVKPPAHGEPSPDHPSSTAPRIAAAGASPS